MTPEILETVERAALDPDQLADMAAYFLDQAGATKETVHVFIESLPAANRAKFITLFANELDL